MLKVDSTNRCDPSIDSPIEPGEFDDELYPNEDGCRALWQAVIGQAIEDATRKGPEFQDKRRGRKCDTDASFYNIDAARAFLCDSNPDLKLVCDMAGLDDTAVSEHIRRMFPELEPYLNG